MTSVVPYRLPASYEYSNNSPTVLCTRHDWHASTYSQNRKIYTLRQSTTNIRYIIYQLYSLIDTLRLDLIFRFDSILRHDETYVHALLFVT